MSGSFGIRNSDDCPPGLDCGRAASTDSGRQRGHSRSPAYSPILHPAASLSLRSSAWCSSATGARSTSRSRPCSAFRRLRERASHAAGAGDPFKATGTFVVAGGTGAFAGATGGGTLTSVGAGDAIVIHYRAHSPFRETIVTCRRGSVESRSAAGLTAAALILAACGGSGGDKAGGADDAQRVVLRLAVDDRPEESRKRFRRAGRAALEGSVKIEIAGRLAGRRARKTTSSAP